MRILLPGNPVSGQSELGGTDAFFEGVAQVKVKHARTIAGVSRGEARPEVLVDAEPDDVVELEFEGGIRQ